MTHHCLPPGVLLGSWVPVLGLILLDHWLCLCPVGHRSLRSGWSQQVTGGSRAEKASSWLKHIPDHPNQPPACPFWWLKLGCACATGYPLTPAQMMPSQTQHLMGIAN